MIKVLTGCTIAIMMASGFEETELTEPQRALLKAGATLKTISPDQGLANGWHGNSWGHFFPIDLQIGEVLGADFDMLVIPGGERSINKLKLNPHTKRIVGHFLDAGKPIAAIDQGVGLLPFSRTLKGRILTAPAALTETLTAAGAQWLDEPMVVDGPIVTARDLEALPAFVTQLLKVFTEANQQRKAA
ncbi:MAG: DJ-1/PfpI family protein [Rhodospirillaceae bacterium]